MLRALIRKGRQLAGDPVLRRWLLLRLVRLTPAEPAFTPHLPPSLGPDWRGLGLEPTATVFSPLPEGAPRGRLTLRLPGMAVEIEPGDEVALVARVFGDPETQLGLHRFAWVPMMQTGDDPRWVGAVWRAWRARFGAPDESWAWHPYTAAERAIILLTFARRHGLPGPTEDTRALLAAHAPAIATRLEYFGEHHTSNHLFNNARGLYLLGLALGLPQATETGARILLAEAGRIFLPSGVLREGSSHYHLLLTRSLASVWLAARGRPEAEAFEAQLRRAVAALPHLALPGRFPLVGDVSPDCPPQHLFCLLPGGDRRSGWMDLLPPDDRSRLAGLLDQAAGSSLVEDGWLRAGFGDWTGLWHVDPDGWSQMPGHGHQDCGGFELHFEAEAVFIDPGRGSYALAGEAEETVTARAHNGLSVDGFDPYPANKPYYAPAFRRAVAGAPPRLAQDDTGVTLNFGGFSRLNGVGSVERSWRFQGRGLVLSDRVEGRGRHAIIRRLHTTCRVETMATGVRLVAASGRRFTISASGAAITVLPIVSWTAYGQGEPASRIEFALVTDLPWSGGITVEAD
ncbi:MAG: heparinase II/III family protein [Phaeospirillum sp.]|nr:heparinase II/III family protein [Phaeospirillum sp.]